MYCARKVRKDEGFRTDAVRNVAKISGEKLLVDVHEP